MNCSSGKELSIETPLKDWKDLMIFRQNMTPKEALFTDTR